MQSPQNLSNVLCLHRCNLRQTTEEFNNQKRGRLQGIWRAFFIFYCCLLSCCGCLQRDMPRNPRVLHHQTPATKAKYRGQNRQQHGKMKSLDGFLNQRETTLNFQIVFCLDFTIPFAQSTHQSKKLIQQLFLVRQER